MYEINYASFIYVHISSFWVSRKFSKNCLADIQTQVLSFRFESLGGEKLSPGDVCKAVVFWVLFSFWELEGLMGVSIIRDAEQLD